MRHFFTALLLFLIWSVIGIGAYSYYIQNYRPTTPEIVIPQKTKEELLNEQLRQGSDSIFSLETLKSLSIFKNSDSIRIQNTALEELTYAYLNKAQTKEVVLTGYHGEEEVDSLGIKRAQHVKDRLVAFGVNEDRIQLAKQTLAGAFDEAPTFDGGVGLSFSDISADRLAALEAEIANKTLYAGFASNAFQPDNTLQAYALELKNFLEKYPSKNIVITGHTDSIGEEVDNEWIGMQRAKNVMKYLASLGIPEGRMQAASEGERSPVAPNNTREGQRLNRRIEIKAN